MQGLYQIADTANIFKKSNPDLKVLGFVLTRYDGRSTLAKSLKNTITQKAAEMGIEHLADIREGIAIKEAAAFQENLFEYAPKAKPAQDYKELFKKIMEG